MSEFLDILDANGHKTGRKQKRSIVHQTGQWHLSIHLWVFLHDRVLVQKRSDSKESFPGCYDATVAGHVSAGESCEQAAIRECCEEIGIKIDHDDIYEVGVLPLIIRNRKFISREFNHIFIVRFDELPDISVDKTEIDSLVEMELSEVEKEIASKNPSFCISHEEVTLLINTTL